jgi:LysM repeat protein
VIEHDPKQGTQPHDNYAATSHQRTVMRAALPWLVGAIVLLTVAGLGGLAAAHYVAEQRAAPSPDAAFLPTPTPSPSATPQPGSTPGPSPTGVAGHSPQPSPTATPAQPAEPTPQPTPTASPLEYTVQRGDSIGRIAIRFNVTPEAIIALNELRNPNRIFPGQVLLIPAATASPTP